MQRRVYPRSVLQCSTVELTHVYACQVLALFVWSIVACSGPAPQRTTTGPVTMGTAPMPSPPPAAGAGSAIDRGGGLVQVADPVRRAARFGRVQSDRLRTGRRQVLRQGRRRLWRRNGLWRLPRRPELRRSRSRPSVRNTHELADLQACRVHRRWREVLRADRRRLWWQTRVRRLPGESELRRSGRRAFVRNAAGVAGLYACHVYCR
jgi:hypothetical protein